MGILALRMQCNLTMPHYPVTSYFDLDHSSSSVASSQLQELFINSRATGQSSLLLSKGSQGASKGVGGKHQFLSPGPAFFPDDGTSPALAGPPATSASCFLAAVTISTSQPLLQLPTGSKMDTKLVYRHLNSKAIFRLAG